MLDRWTSVFPEEQLYVGFFEEISERPRELLRAVFKHIGVSEDVTWDDFPTRERIHEGPGIPLPDHFRGCLEEVYAPEIDRIAARFGGPAKGWRRR